MAIVHIDFRTISWGGPNEDDNNDVWEVEDGSKDPGEIVLADFGTVGTPICCFPAPDDYTLGTNTYHRVFWDVTDGVTALDGYPSTAPKLHVPNMSGVLQATCWYVLPGRGGTPILRARTFDADLNNFRKETPIASATPAGAWPGPNNHSVSTASADAAAKAKDTLTYPAPFQTQPPGEPPKFFKGWLPATPGLTVDPAPGKLVGCKAKTSGLALAVYSHQQPAAVIGGPAVYQAAYDYWAEYWGRRGAEGTGPWGPRGPHDPNPWGQLTQKWYEGLTPAQQQVALGYLAAKAGAKKTEILP